MDVMEPRMEQWNKIDPKVINKLNGQCVIDALSRRRKTSKFELLKCFNAKNSKASRCVQSELNRILANGVKNGFIVESCGKYALADLECAYMNDGDACGSSDEVISIKSSDDEEAPRASSRRASKPGDDHSDDSDESVEEVRKVPTKTTSGRISRPPDRFVASHDPRPYMHPSTGAIVRTWAPSAVAAPAPSTITSGAICSSPSVSTIFNPASFSTPMALVPNAYSTPSIGPFNPATFSTPMALVPNAYSTPSIGPFNPASLPGHFVPVIFSTPIGPITSSTPAYMGPSTSSDVFDSKTGTKKRKLIPILEDDESGEDEECPTTTRAGRKSKKPKRYGEE